LKIFKLNEFYFAKLSLSFLWIFTGVTSIFLAPSIGYTLLAKANVVGSLADFCVIGGSVVDMMIGLWLLTNYKPRLCYIFQIIIIIVYSILLSIIAPAYWLHPFGPLTKNIPILALIFILYQTKENSN
tara:strand:+ start:81026 stop:81409 length:384 start_codon:yes stop_codon:yes gene_type:complete